MPKGWKEMKEDKEKRPTRTGMMLLLNDGDVARMRFLTDREEMFWGYFHAVQGRSRLGKLFTKQVYCFAEDGLECPYDNMADENVARTGRRFHWWVYVYYKLHRKKEKDADWTEEDYFGETMYKEEINTFKILGTGPGAQGVIEQKFDSWYKRFKTWCDRDYYWAREGEQLETKYDLMPDLEMKPSKLPKELLEIKEGLPDLEETVKGKAPTMIDNVNGENGPKEKKSFLESIDDIFDEEKDE